MLSRRLAHRILSNAVMILLIGAGLCACGQKGDLYLPDQEQSSLVRPAGNH